MKIKVVGIIGSEGKSIFDDKQSGSGVGKDTLAELLVTHHGYNHYKFANVLRDMFYFDYNLPVDKKRNKTFEFSTPSFAEYQLNLESPRFEILKESNALALPATQHINQSIIDYAGVLRKLNPDIFVKGLLDAITYHVGLSGRLDNKFVISDVRQFNEFLLLKALNGTLVEIWTAKPLRERQLLDCQLVEFSDVKLSNNRSIESLTETVVSGNFAKKETEFSWLDLSKSHYLEMLQKGYLNEPPFRSQN